MGKLRSASTQALWCSCSLSLFLALWSFTMGREQAVRTWRAPCLLGLWPARLWGRSEHRWQHWRQLLCIKWEETTAGTLLSSHRSCFYTKYHINPSIPAWAVLLLHYSPAGAWPWVPLSWKSTQSNPSFLVPAATADDQDPWLNMAAITSPAWLTLLADVWQGCAGWGHCPASWPALWLGPSGCPQP